MNARLNFIFNINVTSENVIETSKFDDWDVVLVGDFLKRTYLQKKSLLPWVRLFRHGDREVLIGEPKQSLRSTLPNMFETQLLERYEDLLTISCNLLANPSTEVWRLLRTYQVNNKIFV